MKNLSVTRWNDRAESIKALLNSYGVLVCVLEELRITGNDRESQSTASTLLNNIKDVDFYVSMVLMKNILSSL